jgi:hypothetical protein
LQPPGSKRALAVRLLGLLATAAFLHGTLFVGSAAAVEAFTCDEDPFELTAFNRAFRTWRGGTSAVGSQIAVTAESLDPQCFLVRRIGGALPAPSVVVNSSLAGRLSFNLRCTTVCEAMVKLIALDHDEKQCLVRCRPPLAVVCKGRKLRAAGANSLSLLKAFGRNQKKPNVAALFTDVSKAQSKVSKEFTRAEFTPGGLPKVCVTRDDVGPVESKSEAVTQDVLDQLSP